MKLLFDQNISYRILKLLNDQFQGSTSVKTEGMLNSSDKQIWEFAKKHNFIIVTQDSDFNDLNSLMGFPPKIIWIRSGNMKTSIISKILTDYFDEISRFASDERNGCFEIIGIG
jgi:predicted nuclease of predicted toxin-antitoxin system